MRLILSVFFGVTLILVAKYIVSLTGCHTDVGQEGIETTVACRFRTIVEGDILKHTCVECTNPFIRIGGEEIFFFDLNKACKELEGETKIEEGEDLKTLEGLKGLDL